MADQAISELTAATSVQLEDLFVLEQDKEAKKLQGAVLLRYLTEAADGHGGIQDIQLTGTSGRVHTYTIYLADGNTVDFQVTDGDKGEKGDKGDTPYVYIRYAASQPSAANPTISTTPNNWAGFYSGFKSTAPTSWTEYSWYRIRGDTGAPATLTGAVSSYQASESGTVIPGSSGWQSNPPVVPQGQYLWTRTTLNFNTGSPVQIYSVSHFGLDGQGAVQSVNGVAPGALGDVLLTADNIKVGQETVANALAGKQAKVLASGLLKGDGSGGITAALAGTDYQAANKGLPVTLRASGWNSGTKKQTVTVAGVTSANNVLVSPAEASYSAYTEAQVRCCLQSVNTLEFVCEDVPTVDLTVNVLIMA